MAGAIVIGWSSTSRYSLALLTAEDWKLLADTPSNPPLDHPAIKRLREFYGVQGLVRTDREGDFAITRQPDQEFYGIMAFAKFTLGDEPPAQPAATITLPDAQAELLLGKAKEK